MKNQDEKQYHFREARKMVDCSEMYTDHFVGVNNMVTELLSYKGD